MARIGVSTGNKPPVEHGFTARVIRNPRTDIIREIPEKQPLRRLRRTFDCVCRKLFPRTGRCIDTGRLLKRRQILGSRQCAAATTHLFLRVIAELKAKDVNHMLERIRSIGRRLIDAQPRELVVGNIVRRVLGLVREVTEAPTDKENGARHTSGLLGDAAPHAKTILESNSFLANGDDDDNDAEPLTMREIKEDVLNGLREMVDELDQADEQMSGYAVEHIHANEVLLTYTSSLTVQKFLLQAAKRRKFTLIHVEGYPNHHEATYNTVLNGKPKHDEDDRSGESRLKALTAAGVNVIVVPDSAVFAVMARVNKVILPAHAVLNNGGFVAAAGAWTIAKAANIHRVPVVTLAAIYRHSPLYPVDVEAITGLGDAGHVLDYRQGDMVENIDVVNPIFDYIEPDLADLIISNMYVAQNPVVVEARLTHSQRSLCAILRISNRGGSLSRGRCTVLRAAILMFCQIWERWRIVSRRRI